MKKYFLSILGAGLLLTSCQNDDLVMPGTGEEVQATFTISVPDAMGTRAGEVNSAQGGFTNGAGQLNYTVALLNKDNKVMWSATSEGQGTTATFSPTVVLNYEYTILAYATFGNNAIPAPAINAVISDSEAIKNIQTLKGINDESEDAYFCNETIIGSAEMAANLMRPFGKLRLVAEDYGKLTALGIDVQSVKVSYRDPVQNTFNLFNLDFTSSSEAEVETAGKTEYKENSGEYTVFVDYLPAGPKNTSTNVYPETMYPFTIEVTYNDNKTVYTRTFTQDIPVKRNHLTTLRGNFFTTEAALTLTVDEMFEGEEEYGTQGTLYIVDTNNSFDSVIAKIATDKPEYATITLKADATHVTNGGHGSDDLYKAAEELKQVTINGNGHTLTFTGAGVGEFGVKNGLVVLNNLNIKDESVSFAEGAWEYTYLEMGSLKATNVNFQDEISIDGDTAEFTNCTFESNEQSVYAAWITNGTAKFEKCNFTGYRGLKMHEAYGSEIKKVIVNECVFENIKEKPGIAIGNLNADTEVVITNNEFILCQPGDQNKYIYESDTDVTKFNFTESNNKVYKNAVQIANANELVNFANAVKNGNSYSGSLVQLTADIDLAGIEWTPVGQTGATEFKGVFDGCNHTISNLKIDSSAQTGKFYSSGLFGWIESHGQAITIKNVKVNGAVVVGHHNVGVIVGQAQGDAIIENCHVENAEVTNTHANDDACGDKTGGIVGYIAGTTKVVNCSVTNSVIKGARDAGMVVGAASMSESDKTLEYINTSMAKNVTLGVVPGCTEANIGLWLDATTGFFAAAEGNGLLGRWVTNAPERPIIIGERTSEYVIDSNYANKEVTIANGTITVNGGSALVMDTTCQTVSINGVNIKAKYAVTLKAENTIVLTDCFITLEDGGKLINNESGHFTNQIIFSNTYINGELVTNTNISKFIDGVGTGFAENN